MRYRKREVNMQENNKGVVWTNEMKETLRKLVEDNAGTSYDKIAKIMTKRFGVKFTKGSCIGKGRRLGLAPRKEAAPREKKEKTVEIKPVIKPRIPGMKLTIDELQSGDCRYPLWAMEERGGFYCGDPAIEGTSWCKEHRIKVYGSASYRP